jgi:hypothetical protein
MSEEEESGAILVGALWLKALPDVQEAGARLDELGSLLSAWLLEWAPGVEIQEYDLPAPLLL